MPMPDVKCVLIHDNFQNFKSYNIPKAQLVDRQIFRTTSVQISMPAGRIGMWMATTKTGEQQGEEGGVQYRLHLQHCRVFPLLQPTAEERTRHRREGCTVHDRVLRVPADPEGDHRSCKIRLQELISLWCSARTTVRRCSKPT